MDDNSIVETQDAVCEAAQELPPWLEPSALTVRVCANGDGVDEDAAADNDDSDEGGTPERSPQSPAVVCDTCGALYRTPVCKCAQLAMSHPIAKILARTQLKFSASTAADDDEALKV